MRAYGKPWQQIYAVCLPRATDTPDSRQPAQSRLGCAARSRRKAIAIRHAQRHALGRESVVESEAATITPFARNRGGGLHAFRHANSSSMDRLSVPLKA